MRAGLARVRWVQRWRRWLALPHALPFDPTLPRCPVTMQTLLRCGLLERLAMTARQRLIPNLAGDQHRGVGRGPQRQLHR